MTKTFWETAFDNAPGDDVRKALLGYEAFDVLPALPTQFALSPECWNDLAELWAGHPATFAPQAELAARRVAQALKQGA